MHPDIYERDRLVIKTEPFVMITGTLAKDDGTTNVIAKEVKALRVGRARYSDGNSGTRPKESSAPPAPSPSASSPWKSLRILRRLAPEAKSWG